MKTLTAARSETLSFEEGLPEDVKKLAEKVNSLPLAVRQELTEPLENVIRSTLRRKEVLGQVQEAVAQVRLDMKYLLFDLEATRRERDRYKP